MVIQCAPLSTQSVHTVPADWVAVLAPVLFVETLSSPRLSSGCHACKHTEVNKKRDKLRDTPSSVRMTKVILQNDGKGQMEDYSINKWKHKWPISIWKKYFLTRYQRKTSENIRGILFVAYEK